ncbi:MAG: hypothetical protein LUH14_03100 [Clostridiaceae bacterium]|nr:hypothetical protein [Clostridiaceae bacterium]
MPQHFFAFFGDAICFFGDAVCFSVMLFPFSGTAAFAGTGMVKDMGNFVPGTFHTDSFSVQFSVTLQGAGKLLENRVHKRPHF